MKCPFNITTYLKDVTMQSSQLIDVKKSFLNLDVYVTSELNEIQTEVRVNSPLVFAIIYEFYVSSLLIKPELCNKNC